MTHTDRVVNYCLDFHAAQCVANTTHFFVSFKPPAPPLIRIHTLVRVGVDVTTGAARVPTFLPNSPYQPLTAVARGITRTQEQLLPACLVIHLRQRQGLLRRQVILKLRLPVLVHASLTAAVRLIGVSAR